MTRIRHDAAHHTAPATQHVWLEIQRGRTRFPRRPVSSERTLIGCGSTCHLQLGGDGIPMVHSLIVQQADELSIEALVAEPPLIVNDAPCRRSTLQAGDTISIGPFQFTLVMHDHECPGSRSGVPSDRRDCADDAEESDAGELSVEALVDQLETDMQLVEDFEAGRRRGLARLLRAARSQAADQEKLPAPQVLRLSDHRPEDASPAVDSRKAA